MIKLVGKLDFQKLNAPPKRPLAIYNRGFYSNFNKDGTAQIPGKETPFLKVKPLLLNH